MRDLSREINLSSFIRVAAKTPAIAVARNERIFAFSAKTHEAIGKIKTIREIKKCTDAACIYFFCFLSRYRSFCEFHIRVPNEQYPRYCRHYLDKILKIFRYLNIQLFILHNVLFILQNEFKYHCCTQLSLSNPIYGYRY